MKEGEKEESGGEAEKVIQKQIERQ